MIINGKVHCFFEQSGTFKNEFIKLTCTSYGSDVIRKMADRLSIKL